MKLIIAGSRDLICSDPVSFLDYCLALNGIVDVTQVVSGTARGPDRWGEHWAYHHKIDIARYPANWEMFGRAYAGRLRNKLMAEVADELIAIWDGSSTGTLDMINHMKRLKKPFHLVLCAKGEDLSKPG